MISKFYVSLSKEIRLNIQIDDLLSTGNITSKFRGKHYDLTKKVHTLDDLKISNLRFITKFRKALLPSLGHNRENVYPF